MCYFVLYFSTQVLLIMGVLQVAFTRLILVRIVLKSTAINNYKCVVVVACCCCLLLFLLLLLLLYFHIPIMLWVLFFLPLQSALMAPCPFGEFCCRRGREAVQTPLLWASSSSRKITQVWKLSAAATPMTRSHILMLWPTWSPVARSWYGNRPRPTSERCISCECSSYREQYDFVLCSRVILSSWEYVKLILKQFHKKDIDR